MPQVIPASFLCSYCKRSFPSYNLCLLHEKKCQEMQSMGWDLEKESKKEKEKGIYIERVCLHCETVFKDGEGFPREGLNYFCSPLCLHLGESESRRKLKER